MARSSTALSTKRATKAAGRRSAPAKSASSSLVDQMVATGRYTRTVAQRILDRMPDALDAIPAQVTEEVEVTTGFGTKWMYALHKAKGGYTVSFRPVDVAARRQAGSGHTGGFISGTSLSGIPKVYRTQKDAYAAIVDHAKRGQYLLYKNNPKRKVVRTGDMSEFEKRVYQRTGILLENIKRGTESDLLGGPIVAHDRKSNTYVVYVGYPEYEKDGTEFYSPEAARRITLKRNPREGTELWEFRGMRRGYEETPMAVIRVRDTVRTKGREHARHMAEAHRAENLALRQRHVTAARAVENEVEGIIDAALERGKVEEGSPEARRYRGMLFSAFREAERTRNPKRTAEQKARPKVTREMYEAVDPVGALESARGALSSAKKSHARILEKGSDAAIEKSLAHIQRAKSRVARLEERVKAYLKKTRSNPKTRTAEQEARRAERREAHLKLMPGLYDMLDPGAALGSAKSVLRSAKRSHAQILATGSDADIERSLGRIERAKSAVARLTEAVAVSNRKTSR